MFRLHYAIWSTLLCIQYVACDGYFDEYLEKCLSRKSLTNFKLPLEIINDNGALELWFYYNGKYDLYLTYNNGHIFHHELRINEKLTPRIAPDRANCSYYLSPTPTWYHCPYIVNEDAHQVNITLVLFPPDRIYSIDKATEEVTFMEDSTGVFKSGIEPIQIDCINKITTYKTPLPIEVEKNGNHLQVTVKYQGKYDFYNTIELGSICGIQYQLDEKPNPTLEDYVHCSKCAAFSSYAFRCPYNIIEDENDVTISLDKNVYKVNKFTGQVFYERSLIGIDPYKSFERDIHKCINVLSGKNASIPVQVIRNGNFLEIWIKHNSKYDLFETNLSGRICRQDLQSTRLPDVLNLVLRPPAVCFSPSEHIPYHFICPYNILEDDDYIYFRINYSNHRDQHLYAFKRATKESVYRKFATYYDSCNYQDTIKYLRSIVTNVWQ